eukprot:2779905-Rhodomonas_salina.3
MQCPVLRWGMLLRFRCTLSSTEMRYAATRSFTARRSSEPRDVAGLGASEVPASLLSYAPAMPCSVLTFGAGHDLP